MAAMVVNSPHPATFSATSARNPEFHKNLPVTVVELSSRAKRRVTHIWRTTNANQGRTINSLVANTQHTYVFDDSSERYLHSNDFGVSN